MIAHLSMPQCNRWAWLSGAVTSLLLLTACTNASTAADDPTPVTASHSVNDGNCGPARGFALSGRVSDYADVLSPDEEARLSDRLAIYDARRHHQMVIATVPSLSGKEVRDFAQCLGNRWGIGDAARNDGIVILVAPSERKVGIALGSSWGSDPQDPRATPAIGVMGAQFSAGHYVQGLEEGIAVLERQFP